MAKLTWLGEDELHNGAPGPSFCIGFGGIKFPKGEPVEVMDKDIIARAQRNQFFEVEDGDEFTPTHPAAKRRGRPPKVTTEQADDQDAG